MRTLTMLGLRVPVLRLVAAGALGAATEAAGLGLMATATWLLVTAAGQPPITALTVAIVSVRALAISRGGLRYLERLASHDTVLRIVTQVRARIFAALVDRPPTRHADALSRMVSDVEAVQDLVVRVALPLASCGLVAALAVGLTAIFVPAAGLTLLAGLLITGALLPFLAARLVREGATRLAPLRAAYAISTVDLVHGCADLAAYGATARFERAAAAQAEELSTLERSLARRAFALDTVSSIVTGLTAAAMLLVCRSQGLSPVWTAVLTVGTLATGELTAGLVAATRKGAEITGALHRIGELINPTGSTGTATGSLLPETDPSSAADSVPQTRAPNDHVLKNRAPDDVPRTRDHEDHEDHEPKDHEPKDREPEDHEPEEGEPKDREPEDHEPEDREPEDRGREPMQGKPENRGPAERFTQIKLTGVGVAGRLEDVDLLITPGARIAIIGASGAGKSTLLGVIAGAIAPDRGEVTGAGPAFSVATGLMADAHLFHATMRDNLLLAKPDATEAELARAAQVAGLGDFLSRYTESVGENGGELSGGQRQRLTLARAVLAAPAVLLLDEPTEGLDPAQADAVLTRVLADAGPRAVVLVTHSLAALAQHHFDEIVVMDEGRIVSRSPTH